MFPFGVLLRRLCYIQRPEKQAKGTRRGRNNEVSDEELWDVPLISRTTSFCYFVRENYFLIARLSFISQLLRAQWRSSFLDWLHFENMSLFGCSENTLTLWFSVFAVELNCTCCYHSNSGCPQINQGWNLKDLNFKRILNYETVADFYYSNHLKMPFIWTVLFSCASIFF